MTEVSSRTYLAGYVINEMERTENRDHRSSDVDSDSQAREKSYSDTGGTVTLRRGFSTPVAVTGGVGSDLDTGDVINSPLIGNIVFSPDARKIPPPIRLGFILSRAFLASLNVRGGSD